MQTHPAELSVGHPRRGPIGLVVETLVSIGERRRLIWYLASSSIRRNEGKSVLGNAWLILDPALQLAIYYLLVGVVLRRPEPAFPLFLFAAILPWRWFTMAITSATESVRREGKVMQQIAFPQIVLPAAAIVSSVASFAFGLIPLGALYFVYPERLSAWILTVPAIMLVQVLWTLPLAIALSAVNVFVQDFSNLVKHGLRLAFYVSPALFSFDRLITIAGGYPPLDTILLLNPMVWILNAYRSVLYAGESPDWSALLIAGLASIPFTLLSIYLFRRLSPSFAKVL